ncbi:LysR family transcriptional regulator [Achromobacter aloeverae]|uniref:LysR family transcriptional regulator n=1 Tax=Achromobacter aloeverae TaxID=1750518 RepID=A0A4Q1HIP6_9BURK|nr:LysR family transcriptional regulator [Achromobacter aloeverae]RXN87951.1 LysR family transcriptional regulator [Achromobacter aloeverae]
MSERLNGIEAFVAAVETGNFALAAQRLHLTRSAVGKSVARLEARLGTRLFHRTTRSQSLTEDGLAYYERCRRALAELEAADAAIEAGRQEPRGMVRITMPELIGRTRIAPLLLELGQRHPQLGFDASFSDRSVDLIEEGYDLAIRSGPLADSAVLAARLLGQQCMRVYAAPAYLAAHGGPDSVAALMADLDRYAYVGYSRHTGPHPWQFHDADGRVIDLYVPARHGFGCNSLEVTAMAACQGMGLARLPRWLVADAVAEGRLVPVFDEPHPFGYALNAVWPHARALPLKTRVVIDMLAQRLPPLLAAGPSGMSA